MKSFIAPVVLGLASIISAAVIPMGDQVTWTNDDEVVQHETAAGKYCIKLRSPREWHYQFDGRIWGKGAGKGPMAEG